MKTSDRVPVLDGLRALSISLVLLAHLGGTSGSPLSATLFRWGFIGNLGVRVFFVISGYLITGLLFRELGSSGTIALPRFYLRRTFRLLVPYYAFLLLLTAASQLGWVQLHPGDLFHAFTYSSNYQLDRSWSVGHLWSLAVEEQFYLLWPAVLVFAGKRRSLFIAFAFLLVAPLLRMAEWLFLPQYGELIGHSFETIGDALATGCLLAGCREWLWRNASYRAFLSSRLFALVPLAVVLCRYLDDRPRFAFLFGATAMNLGCALCVDFCVRFPARRVARALSLRPIVYVGQLSYSIYLWQQVFLNRNAVSFGTTFPVNLALVAAAALLSYYLVERPSLQLRQRFEQWAQQRFPAFAASRSLQVGADSRAAPGKPLQPILDSFR